MEWLNKIYFAPLVFKFKAKEEFILPSYKGITFRGGFGYTLKKSSCALKNIDDCKECLLRSSCVYAYVFETPRPEDSKIMRKYEHVPHPFVLTPPLEEKRIIKQGEYLFLELVLIGRAVSYFPYFIVVLKELGEKGLGSKQGRYELESVFCEEKEIFTKDSKEIIQPKTIGLKDIVEKDKAAKKIEFCLLTPLKLQRQGELIQEDLTFQDIFRSLLRRISLLAYFHCGVSEEELQKVDFRGLIEKASTIEKLAEDLNWFQLTRFSSRQKRRIPVGGLQGKVVFQGDFGDFWDFLKLGEYLHVGKNTSFGLGKYRVILN